MMMDRKKICLGNRRIFSNIMMWFLIAAILLSFSAPAFAGTSEIAQIDVSNHTESPVVQVCAKNDCSLAVCENGTVLCSGGTKEWRDAVSQWDGIECVLDSFFARKKDGSYTSIYGQTNLPVLEEPIAITMGSAGNWIALLPDGVLLCSSEPNRVDDFSIENETGFYGMSDYRFKEVVFGPDSCYGLLFSGTVLPFAHGSVKNEIANWTGVKHLCFCDGYVPVALKEDGTVLSASTSELVDTSEWTDTVKLQANFSLTVGLRSDGTVLATGGEYWSEPFADDVSDWTDIIDIAVNDNTWSSYNGGGTDNTFALGLKTDRTVVLAGDTSKAFIKDLQDTVSRWSDIIQLSVGKNHILGLKADGTIVTAGDNSCGQCNIVSEKYSEIIQPLIDVACALRKDGTVAVTRIGPTAELGYSDDLLKFKRTVETWTDIKKIVVLGSMDGIAGIKEDGSVVVELDDGVNYDIDYYKSYRGCGDWTNIDDIVSNSAGTFGLKKNGTVIATDTTVRQFEENYRRKFTFDGWKDITELQLSANMNGDFVLLGLSEDGTLYYNGACMTVGDWNGIKDISAIDCSPYVYLVLKKDGTADIGGIGGGFYAGKVFAWEDISQIKVGSSAAAGLKNDGTVVVVGQNYPEELNWRCISSIYLDPQDNIYGLFDDGSVTCYIEPDQDPYHYSVDQEEIKKWRGLDRLSFLLAYDEIIVIGSFDDGSIISTHDLSF